MNTEEIISRVIKKNLGIIALEVSHAGKGASGSVYCVKCDGEPYMLAVKISPHEELMLKEYEMLTFLRENTESKIPKTYFLDKINDVSILAMEFVEGISGNDKSILLRLGRKHLAESIIDNLLVIQKAHNDKFGPYDDAKYDTWQDYYKEFSDEIYNFCLMKHSQGELDDIVMRAVETSYRNFDKIFAQEINPATLIHGDYWMPNFIINKKSMELKAVVDPFNVMWADPEYELFGLTVGNGKQLRLYEMYKSKVKVSRMCDLKVELYALYSELLWYKKLGTISHDYLRQRSRKLIKQMDKHII